MTAPALAALLLLAPAAGAVSTDGWPLTPEESARLDQEQEAACAKLSAILDSIEARRKAFPGAADQDEAGIQWAQEFPGALPFLELAERAAVEHKERNDATRARIISYALSKAAAGNLAMRGYLGREDMGGLSGEVSPEFAGIQHRNAAIHARNGKVHARFWAEESLYQEAMSHFKQRQARDARDKLTVGASSAVAVLLLAAATWAARRHALAADAPVLPAPALASPSPDAQTIPSVIGGNIDVVRPIGRGGMGEVYEGLDRTLQRRVALKRLRSELTNSPNDLSRLLAEARLVAALKHDNIVAIHAVEMEAGQVFLVFEYVDGPSLSAHIAQFRQIAWPEALRIFSGAAAALGAAHAKDIVHRDLKPGNIMLDSKGVVKVMDFGIAHQAAQAVSRLTRSGAWGTPPYMSPEQELGEVNKGVDLFALNVCLYEMLTGELPFTGPNFLAQKRERVYIPVTQAVPALPKALDAFFATAFDPDPAKRFQDALTLAAAANAIA